MQNSHDGWGGGTTSERVLRWAVFGGAASAVAYLCLSMLRPFASVIAWAIILAILCSPAHQRVVAKTGRAALSAFIVSLLTVLACVVPLLLLGSIAVQQCVALVHTWQGALNAPPEPLSRLGALAMSVASRVGMDDAGIERWIQQHVSELAGSAGRYALSFATSVLGAVVSSVLVIFALFLLLRDGNSIVEHIGDLLPFERRRSDALLGRIRDAVQASVYGVVVIALLQGVLYGAMLWLLGVPSAALWGMITMFASLLPVVGAFTVWGPATVYLAFTGRWPQAMVLAIWGTFVVSGIDNMLRPRLVAGRVGLSELTMLFAMLGGVSVFGGLGIVLGPTAFATAAAILDILRAPHADAPAAPSIAARQHVV